MPRDYKPVGFVHRGIFMAKTITSKELNAAKLSNRTQGDYNLLKKVIKSHPRIANADITEVFMKIAVIDSTNTTHLSTAKDKISLKELAKIIMGIKDIDERIKKGDAKVVEIIVERTKKKYDYNPFSFATKFCCYHNRFVYGRDDYSIYDSRVKKKLPDYEGCTATKNKLNTWRNNGEYEKFNDCVWSVLETNKLTGEKFPRQKLDRLLWSKTAD